MPPKGALQLVTKLENKKSGGKIVERQTQVYSTKELVRVPEGCKTRVLNEHGRLVHEELHETWEDALIAFNFLSGSKHLITERDFLMAGVQ